MRAHSEIIIIILFIKSLISNFSLRSRVVPLKRLKQLKRYRARWSTLLLKSAHLSHRFARRTASTPGRRKIAESSAVNNLRVVSRRSFISFFFLFVEGQKRVGRLKLGTKRMLKRDERRTDYRQ